MNGQGLAPQPLHGGDEHGRIDRLGQVELKARRKNAIAILKRDCPRDERRAEGDWAVCAWRDLAQRAPLAAV